MKVLLSLTPILVVSVSVAQIAVAPPPLESRIAQASKVCICELAGSLGSANDYNLTVIQGYKDVAKGNVIRASSPESFDRLAPMIHYLLFLGSRGGSAYWPISGAVPVPRDFPLTSSASEATSLESDIDDYLREKYRSGANTDAQSIIELLDQFQVLSPASLSLLGDVAAGKENTVALWAATILLKRGRGASTLFRAYLERLETAPSREIPLTGSAEFVFLRFATHSEIGDFEKLSHSDSTEVRHAALLAIKKVADRSSTAFLIKELDSSDIYDEYIAVSALADIYGKTGEFGPGMGEFERDRGRYIHLWKTWFKHGDGS
ncbi:MAG TPA: hypothetical protein VFE06_02030 [Acidobacteriaceae bacterium]|jgi:hypothetical protein|nr:hypothetical protein [Acidobacteriaceae bacterium]